MQNFLREKLDSDAKVLGCFVGFYCPAVVEMLGISGFDFVVIDTEHGALDWGAVEHMVRAAEVQGTTPIVRTANAEPSTILKAFDCGARGIHVPQVSSAQKAREVVRAAKFPPVGNRGVAWSARSHFYGAGGGAEYLDQHNRQSIVAIHLETQQAVDNAEEILSVPGIDIAYVGPADLSVSMGYASEGPTHTQVEAAADHILRAANKTGVRIGYQVGDAQAATERFEWGASYVGVGITSILTGAFKTIVSAKNPA